MSQYSVVHGTQIVNWKTGSNAYVIVFEERFGVSCKNFAVFKNKTKKDLYHIKTSHQEPDFFGHI